jgi:hypothetical protein
MKSPDNQRHITPESEVQRELEALSPLLGSLRGKDAGPGEEDAGEDSMKELRQRILAQTVEETGVRQVGGRIIPMRRLLYAASAVAAILAIWFVARPGSESGDLAACETFECMLAALDDAELQELELDAVDAYDLGSFAGSYGVEEELIGEDADISFFSASDSDFDELELNRWDIDAFSDEELEYFLQSENL